MPETDDNEIVGADLQPKHHKAIAALLDQPTITKAAIAAGISHATMHRWLLDPNFHRAYMHARWKAVQQSIAQVQSFTSEAASVLRSIMNNTDLPAYARVSAANSVFRNGFRGIEIEDHGEQLDQIQDDIAAIKSGEE
jgi:hypothetical protein